MHVLLLVGATAGKFPLQISQVMCAGFSSFVPISDSVLADRMSITLAILLTLVVFTQERPTIIESIPYPTLHDKFEQYMVGSPR